jgi:hypothetical protein
MVMTDDTEDPGELDASGAFSSLRIRRPLSPEEGS